MKKIAIEGSRDSNEQKEIIEILKSLGGKINITLQELRIGHIII